MGRFERLILPSFFLFSIVASGQIVYTSPFTHTYPTIFKSRIVKVDRRITFEPNTITIATETTQGKERFVRNPDSFCTKKHCVPSLSLSLG